MALLAHNNQNTHRSDPEVSRNITLIVKPVGNACNLACKYCYTQPEDKGRRMALETYRNALSAFGRVCNNLTVIWHGGEPLLAGLEFYLDVMELEEGLRAEGLTIENRMQTNGTLIDEDFSHFFRDNEYRLGISIDGAEEIHNANRAYPDGQGTFHDAIRGLRILKESGIRNVGCLAVLTRECLRRESDIYHSFVRLGVRDFKVSQYMPGGKGDEYRRELALTPSEYGQILKTLYDIWMEGPEDILISPLHKIVESMLSGRNNLCEYLGNCHDFFSMDPDGYLYPCGRFDGNKEFVLGNANKDDVGRILSRMDDVMGERRLVTSHEPCSNCSFRTLCNGGCAYMSWRYYGHILSRTPYCASKRMIFEHVYDDLVTQLEVKHVRH